MESWSFPPTYDENYFPESSSRYWFPQRETMLSSEREGLILARLKTICAYAYERAPFYRRKWDDAGFHPSQLKSLEDFESKALDPTTDWVEVGPRGRIEAFTMVYAAFQGLPDPPYAFGYVLLDGADTAIGGFFRGVDLTDADAAAKTLAIGTAVTTKFAEKRKGDVLDFWFEIDVTRA